MDLIHFCNISLSDQDNEPFLQNKAKIIDLAYKNDWSHLPTLIKPPWDHQHLDLVFTKPLKGIPFSIDKKLFSGFLVNDIIM